MKENASYNISFTLRSCITFEDGDEWDSVSATLSDAYKGTFNGNGHTICNLKINKSGMEGIRIGFFGDASVQTARLGG